MRLIDADKLENDIAENITVKAVSRMLAITQGQPTVKAIPIEWIKRYIAEEGIYPNRELLSVEQADAIERMIENWEKENEKDI